MLSGTTRDFEIYLRNNLEYIHQQSRLICNGHPDHKDIANNVVTSLFEKLIASTGFTGSFNSYLFASIHYAWANLRKKQNKRHILTYDNPYLKEEIEEYYVNEDHNSQEHFNQIEVTSRYLLEYLEKYHSPKNVSLFKSYHFTNANTYQKLVKQANVKIDTVKNVMRMIKKDLQTNLINYIKFQLKKEVYKHIINYSNYEVSNKLNVRNITTGKFINPDKKGRYFLKNDKRRFKHKIIEQLVGSNFTQKEISRFERIAIK